ncbi:MAG: peptide chain release factor N(5)-glutamine methyltransferase [Solirubrobacterales bacterium]
MATTRELTADAAARLKAAGVDDATHDAELLLATALGVTRPQLIAGAIEPNPSQLALFEQWIERRAAREPVAYITGAKGFRRIELAVDRRVLIPRPETELLVAVVKVDRPCGVLDVATGSGAVALALADELPDATIVASDVSADALEVAAANAERLGMTGRVSFIESDLLAAVEGVFDAIAANLPYIDAREIDTLQPEITEYEPRSALDGGEDGLELVRRLVGEAIGQLRPNGLLALEIGDTQAAATAEILRAAGFIDVEAHADLAGRDRVVSGRAR